LLEELDAVRIFHRRNENDNGFWRIPWLNTIAKFHDDNGKESAKRRTFIQKQERWVSYVCRHSEPLYFWMRVLERFPPQMKPKDVIHRLCTISPLQPPSETVVYKQIMTKAENCRIVGKALAWNDVVDVREPDFPGEDELEAMRIYGSSENGSEQFGTLPDAIVDALKDAGIYFLVVAKEKRILPLCWKKAADAVGLEYAAAALAVPSMHPFVQPPEKFSWNTHSSTKPTH
jgi:hypothetical protein